MTVIREYPLGNRVPNDINIIGDKVIIDSTDQKETLDFSVEKIGLFNTFN